MTDRTTIDPLRQRMIEDMAARKLGPGIAEEPHPRLQAVRGLAAALARYGDGRRHRGVPAASCRDRVGTVTRNRTMTGVRFLFRVTLRRHDLAAEIYHLKEPQKVPLILSQDEAERLLAMADTLRNRLLLSLGYGAGLRAGEVVRLKVKHNRRLVSADDNGVAFRWKDYRVDGPDRWKTMTLTAHEFIRRFLMHVLPKGFHRIRHYGLFANGDRAANLASARELLGAAPRAIEVEEEKGRRAGRAARPALPCPRCGGRMIVIEVFARGLRAEISANACSDPDQDRHFMDGRRLLAAKPPVSDADHPPATIPLA